MERSLLLLPLLILLPTLASTQTVPSSPLDLSAKRITSTEIHLTWKEPLGTFSYPTIQHNPHSTPISKQNLLNAQSESTLAYSDTSSIDVLKDTSPSNYAPRLTRDFQYIHRTNSEDDVNVWNSSTEKFYRRKKKRRRDAGDTTEKANDTVVVPLNRTNSAVAKSIPDEEENDDEEEDEEDDEMHIENNDNIHYSLYYEKGHLGDLKNDWEGSLIHKSSIVTRVRRVILRHDDKFSSIGVGYTLKDLDPYTYYRVWVHAFYASQSDNKDSPLDSSLSPPTTKIVCLTDVPPPSPPILKNLSCDQPPGTLSLQWMKPEKFVKSLTSYTIKLKQLGSTAKPFTLSVDGSTDQLEIAISLLVEIKNNVSVYEVKLYASSDSIVQKGHQINGTETEPHQVIMTPDCVAAAPVPESLTAPMLGFIFTVIALLAAILLILLAIYHRGCATLFKKCYPMSYLFLEEGVPIGGDGCGENGMSGKTDSQINCPNKAVISPTHAVVFWGAAENKNNVETSSELLWDALHPPVAADKFFAHTAALHADGDIGFSKEYELIQSKSSMLSHTSHHSQHPDNRHKNRYLNITAYDHSRVSLPVSSACMCEAGKEHRKGCMNKPNAPPTDSPSHCDYINANFIDGIVAEIDAELAKYIIEQNNKRKITQKKKLEAAESFTTPSQPTSEVWISVDESQRPFNHIPAKSEITEGSEMNASLTSETKNLLSDKSLHDSYINTNNAKGKLSLDLDKKDDKKILTPNSDILANTCRLSINLDRKEEKQDEFKTEKIIKESKSKKRSTSADTRDIVVDKKSSSRGHSKNSSVVVAATDNSPSTNAPKIEGAFLNIEFSGIVDSERELQKAREAEKLIEANKLAKEIAEETLDNLDDLFVQIDGESYRVNSSWLLDRRRYIGTQGPTPGTLSAFWRMVWDHQVVVIVMITNLVERGRRKCDMYWPKEGSEIHGLFVVTTLKEDVMATYTVRTFDIKNIKLGESRSVLQYHYTVWPDHGTPEHPLAVLRFREAARKAVSPQAGAVLVHCSAGVGRTGTYIVLDAMLNHLRLTGSLNVFGFLCHVRSQRNFLVQTEEQYVFIHDALLEAIQSGDTEVPVENSKEYLQNLIEPFPEGYASTFLSNLKCGPYGAPLLEKSNENLSFPFNNDTIKRINSEECDFAMWSNLHEAQYSNDKTLDECRNDIVSHALQEAKAKMDSKVSADGTNNMHCNGDSTNDHDDTLIKNGDKVLVNGNGDDCASDLKGSLKRLNNFDDNVINEVDEITPENSLEDTKDDDKRRSNSDDYNKSLTPKKDPISDKVDTSSINSANLARSDHSTSYEKLNGLCNKVSEESKASSVSNDDVDVISNDNNSNGNANKANEGNGGVTFSAENSNTITSSISSDTNNINLDNSFKDKRSSNFSPSQYGPNQDGVESYRKDKTFRAKCDENYELLGGSGRPGGLGGTSADCFAGSHRFACQKKDTSGKKPKNLLEHQFKLITSFEPSKFHIVSACKQVNASKNRRGSVLPIESGRVHLIPKPGVEGTDYINATWLQGHRSLREYIVTQHPLPNTVGDMYRMLWDHSCQIIVMLSNCSYDPECKSFWPTEKNPEISAYNYNIRYISEEKFVAKRISLCDLNNKKNLHKVGEDDSSQESPLQSPSSLSSNKGFVLKLTKGSQRISPVSSSSSDQRKSSQYSPKEVVVKNNDTNSSHADDNSDNSNFYKRQSSNDHQDEERLIPKLDEPPSLEGTEEFEELKKLNNEAKSEGYSFDKSELRIETMMNSDSKTGKLSPQKHLSNGDPFTPNDDVSKRSQPKSPSKISLKSLRINSPILKSPTKFKFDFGGKNSIKSDDAQGRKSPQNSSDERLSFEPKFSHVPLVNMSQLREGPEEIGLDCVITTTHISINSVQDDYELKVKLIECPRWLADLDYDENSDTDEDSEDEDYEMEEKAMDFDQRLRAYTGVFGLPEYVTKCQDEAKNSPVVVVDKMGGARAVALCALSGALRRQSRDVYSLAKLHHGRRAGAWRRASDIRALYEALAAYEHPPASSTSAQVTTQL